MPISAPISCAVDIALPITPARVDDKKVQAELELLYQAIKNLQSTVAQNNYQLGLFRNKIINGDMQVSQVNGGTAVTPASSVYIIDQWAYSPTQTSKLTFQQVVDAPSGFKYSTKITVVAQYSPLSTDAFVLYQPIEGQNIVDLGFGTAAAATVAVSLWIKGSVAGNYSIAIRNSPITRSYVGVIPVTTSWAKQTIILIADNTGTWATDNTIGLSLSIDLGCGSNYNTTVGTWQSGSFIRSSGAVSFVNQTAGSTLNITGVQLEQVSPGATSGTAFEHVPYATQLQWCQRYLPYFPDINTYLLMGQATSGTAATIVFPFKVQTRVPVTGFVSAGAQVLTAAGGGINCTLATFVWSGTTGGSISFSVASGLVAGNATLLNLIAPAYFTGAQM